MQEGGRRETGGWSISCSELYLWRSRRRHSRLRFAWNIRRPGSPSGQIWLRALFPGLDYRSRKRTGACTDRCMVSGSRQVTFWPGVPPPTSQVPRFIGSKIAATKRRLLTSRQQRTGVTVLEQMQMQRRQVVEHGAPSVRPSVPVAEPKYVPCICNPYGGNKHF